MASDFQGAGAIYVSRSAILRASAAISRRREAGRDGDVADIFTFPRDPRDRARWRHAMPLGPRLDALTIQRHVMRGARTTGDLLEQGE